ncbi:protein kinase [Xanthomonas sp. 4461]|uniref:protein kinase domain-containing protein n=1 Tax=Xanthomonas sp. 4461 TaxID=3035313 RepID=UPI00216A9AAA|nr:protein kinase [Xanthomonas sp. 4461]MCS3810501.1 serine/threonine-protein kinase [Xanthomonas sp. 4461]
MTPEVRSDVEARLNCYLLTREGYVGPKFVDSGGSAALYRVETPWGPRAIKVYDPAFLVGPTFAAEKRRLELQRALIGHACPTLVEILRVDEADGTAFVEMEFLEWPQLKRVLGQVPDSSVAVLIKQLVEAVTYLERLDIVHRDIKPENIHVSPDFSALKLIDLGVARELVLNEEEAVSATDHGALRPFIATAQYSSPEYLFRLDAPSPTLWKGLSLYQVGAVLHDLIVKSPLFQQEVSLGNRWLVARAVLSRVPSFPDANPTRLAAFKALAARCLVKDLSTRLSLVDWSDFDLEASTDQLSTLRVRLTKEEGAAGLHAHVANDSRLAFERSEFTKRFCELIRTELTAVCTNKVPFTLKQSQINSTNKYVFEFALGTDCQLQVILYFSWQDGLQRKSADVGASAVLRVGGSVQVDALESFIICVATINEAEEVSAYAVACSLAAALGKALDITESSPDKSMLNGIDIGTFAFSKA